MEKILFIEDDIQLAQVVKIYLEQKNYLVSTTFSYSGAEKWLEETNKPDLIICDIGLPDGDGIELCKKIKTNIKTRKIPVIILTGMADNILRVKAKIESTADLYLNKPIDLEDLYKAVKALISKYQEEQSLLKNIYIKKFAGK